MKWDGVDDDVKWDDDSTLMVALIDQVVESECKVRNCKIACVQCVRRVCNNVVLYSI